MRRFFLRHLRKFRFLPPKLYASIHYEYFTGKKLKWDAPTEFNEKIQWLKVFYRPQILTQLVDKYAVREYIKSKIGSQYLNELYQVCDNPEDINYDSLPNKFVIKTNHASGYNIIVSNKSELKINQANKVLKKWLKINQYYRMGQEWAYKDVKPKLIVEKFLENKEESSLVDYKFYCFNGTAKLIQVHLDRDQNHKKGFFDLDFNPLPFRNASPDKSISSKIMKPDNLDEMKDLSEKLAKNFPFVRVDFYSINGKSIFGEMTFYPSDGRRDLIPDKYNSILGNYINLPEPNTT